jgi:deoxyribose-phosphate aldolase
MSAQILTIDDLNQYIDYTNLRADCSKEDIISLCNVASAKSFMAVCVPPYFVELAKKVLDKCSVKIATVVGFPLGYQTISVKNDECKRYLELGADEIDVVVNIAAIKSKDWSYVSQEIDSLTTTVKLKGKLIKIILETALLTSEEIIRVCQICTQFESDFVKTSTGYSLRGASVEDILLIKANIGPKVKIKASGGIKSYQQAFELINAGANRIGTSSIIELETI